MQYMSGNILFMYDSWADLVVHLLILKSSMSRDPDLKVRKWRKFVKEVIARKM